MGREVGTIFSCCFMLSTTACSPGPAVSGKADRSSDALKENEQLFHTWSDSLYSAEEQVNVNTLFCSRGRPCILIPQFLWVSVHWLCEQCHSLPGFCSTSCSSTCRLCAGQNKYITFSG